MGRGFRSRATLIKQLGGVVLAIAMAAGLCTTGIRASEGPAASVTAAQVTGPPTPGPGTTGACDDFKLALLPFGLISFDIADEGWVWVDPARSTQAEPALAEAS